MNEILAHSLGGKSVVGTDGSVVGTLYTITMEPESGELRDLVVESPSQSSSTAALRPDDEDRLQIPVSRIETVDDQIVVQSDG